MSKHLLIWNPAICRNIRGEDIGSQLPDIFSTSYRGEMASEILKMPRKNPIAFDAAVFLINEKLNEARFALDAKKTTWYYDNFIQFISDCGYHIELSGDEFELPKPSADA